MRSARAAAIVSWLYVAAWAVPAPFVMTYLWRNGRLLTFFGLFEEVYGGPWSERFDQTTFVRLLALFMIGSGITAVVGVGAVHRHPQAVVRVSVSPASSSWLGGAATLPLSEAGVGRSG